MDQQIERLVEDFFRHTHEKFNSRFFDKMSQIFPDQARTMSRRTLEDYATQQEQQCARIFVQYFQVADPEDIKNICYQKDFYGCTKSQFWTWSLFFLCIVISWISGFMVSKYLYKKEHDTTVTDVRPTTTWIPRKKNTEIYDTLPPTYETVVEK